IPQVRAGHDRPAEGAGDGAEPLSAVQPAAHGARNGPESSHAGAGIGKRIVRAPGPAPALARRAGLHARCAVAHRPGHRFWQRPVAGSRRAPDAGRGGPLLRVPPHRRVGRGRRQDRGGNLGHAASQWPVGRLYARRNERRTAALMPADETQLLYSLCLHGRGELGLAPDEYAALTMVLLRLLAFKPVSGVGGVGESAEKKTLTQAEAASSSPAAAVS